VLECRYGEQLSWQLVAIGLRDEVTEPMRETFDPAAASRLRIFRDRYSMPFALHPKQRAAATGRACRAIVLPDSATPASEFRVLRALQFANFISSLLLDDDTASTGPVGREDVIPERALDVMHLLVGVRRQ
jgi:hypothetical protein